MSEWVGGWVSRLVEEGLRGERKRKFGRKGVFKIKMKRARGRRRGRVGDGLENKRPRARDERSEGGAEEAA